MTLLSSVRKRKSEYLFNLGSGLTIDASRQVCSLCLSASVCLSASGWLSGWLSGRLSCWLSVCLCVCVCCCCVVAVVAVVVVVVNVVNVVWGGCRSVCLTRALALSVGQRDAFYEPFQRRLSLQCERYDCEPQRDSQSGLPCETAHSPRRGNDV